MTVAAASVRDALGAAVDALAAAGVEDPRLDAEVLLAEASGLAATIALERVPVPAVLAGEVLRAATWGDDYQLLFAMSPDRSPPVPATRIGAFAFGAGLSLTRDGAPVPLPDRLGYLHGG